MRLGKMTKLPEEYLQIYEHFQEEKCLMKANAGYLKSVTDDMKLQESKEYLLFRIERYNRMFLIRIWYLVKHNFLTLQAINLPKLKSLGWLQLSILCQ